MTDESLTAALTTGAREQIVAALRQWCDERLEMYRPNHRAPYAERCQQYAKGDVVLALQKCLPKEEKP